MSDAVEKSEPSDDASVRSDSANEEPTELKKWIRDWRKVVVTALGAVVLALLTPFGSKIVDDFWEGEEPRHALSALVEMSSFFTPSTASVLREESTEVPNSELIRELIEFRSMVSGTIRNNGELDAYDVRVILGGSGTAIVVTADGLERIEFSDRIDLGEIEVDESVRFVAWMVEERVELADPFKLATSLGIQEVPELSRSLGSELSQAASKAIYWKVFAGVTFLGFFINSFAMTYYIIRQARRMSRDWSDAYEQLEETEYKKNFEDISDRLTKAEERAEAGNQSFWKGVDAWKAAMREVDEQNGKSINGEAMKRLDELRAEHLEAELPEDED